MRGIRGCVTQGMVCDNGRKWSLAEYDVVRVTLSYSFQDGERRHGISPSPSNPVQDAEMSRYTCLRILDQNWINVLHFREVMLRQYR